MKNARTATPPRIAKPKNVALKGTTTIENGMLCFRYSLAHLGRLVTANSGMIGGAGTGGGTQVTGTKRGRPAGTAKRAAASST